MKETILLLLTVMTVFADDLPPSCNRPVYCNSELLEKVQLARLYNDSKTFVDLELRYDENKTLADFQTLLNQSSGNPSRDQIKTFVDDYFQEGNELENWSPPDFNENPRFLYGIRDEKLREFGKNINAIWPTLGRKVRPEVFKNPNQFSLIPVTHGFIIPGGRFKELYYWDTYWIVEGLLISGMVETARGVIENLIELLIYYGHIPNGGRCYYEERSQPPLLSAMVSLYLRETNDIQFLKANIHNLENEIDYWLSSQIVSFEKDDQIYTQLRYYAPSDGPRPESYYEDYESAKYFKTDEEKSDFYIELKSAAESGWDFSSRWFINSKGENTGNLTTLKITDIIPVDLNAIFANALQNVANFQRILGRPRRAFVYAQRARQWRSTIEKVFWNEQDGIWYDYNSACKQHRKYFYPTNISPLWMGAVEKSLVRKHASRVIQYIRNSKGIDFPGGVPASLLQSGEQWDFPNAWPPLVSIMVNGLDALGTQEGKWAAFNVAQTWVRACRKGYLKSQAMFEKYNVELPGEFGSGGEYIVQAGFGWSNGVVLEFLAKYGKVMTSIDSRQNDFVGLSDRVIGLEEDAFI